MPPIVPSTVVSTRGSGGTCTTTTATAPRSRSPHAVTAYGGGKATLLSTDGRRLLAHTQS